MSLFAPVPPTVVIGDRILCTKHVQGEPCKTCPYCALQLVSEAMVEANLPEARNAATIRVIWGTSQSMLSLIARGRPGR